MGTKTILHCGRYFGKTHYNAHILAKQIKREFNGEKIEILIKPVETLTEMREALEVIEACPDSEYCSITATRALEKIREQEKGEKA